MNKNNLFYASEKLRNNHNFMIDIIQIDPRLLFDSSLKDD